MEPSQRDPIILRHIYGYCELQTTFDHRKETEQAHQYGLQKVA